MVTKRVGGYKKLKFCAQQAERDKLMYFWVDTCCIDKSNNTELSEAINSMFKWYQNAAKCYVYLSDVSAEQGCEAAFQKSVWFKRGWTLQELIAPRVVEFFSKEGTKIGDKTSLLEQVQKATGISVEALQGKLLSEINEQERFSWTIQRETTVEEDIVYCLLGIFDVHMPLIYSEGRQKALVRLQREIRLQADPGLEYVKKPVWIVPFERNLKFTGREAQLAALEGSLFTTSRTSRVAVTGLGGVGKTHLVLEMLHRIKEKQPACSIMWVTATSTESVQQGYLAMAQQLDIPGCEDEQADVKKLVQDYLNQDEAGQWVLVFDNADDLSALTQTALVPAKRAIDGTSKRASVHTRGLVDCLPRSKRGCIVFTTRNREVAVRLAQSSIVSVSEMAPDSAIELLNKLLIRPELTHDSKAVTALLEALTNLPLAIVQATAYINAKGISLTDYKSLLEEKEEEVIELLSKGFEEDGHHQDLTNSIAATWLVSFEYIRRSNPLAAEYLSFMACICSRDVPKSLLPKAPSRVREEDAIGLLDAYSFIRRQNASTALDVHRLVQLTTRNWLRMEGSLSEQTEKAMRHIKHVFPDQNHQNRAIWRTYLPHVQQILESNLVSKGEEYRLSLLQMYGVCLSHDGRWAEAEAIFYDIATISRSCGDAVALWNSTNCLASTYSDRGRWTMAQQLYVQSLDVLRSALGADDPSTLNCASSLIAVWSKQGRWAEAEGLYVQIIKVLREKLGLHHDNTLSSMHNLATIYGKQGRWKEAEKLCVQVVNGFQAKLEPDHPKTLRSMGHLASIYWRQGRLVEAQWLQVRVLETTKVNLGAEHPDTLTSMSDLALTYWRQDQLVEAEHLQVEVLQLQKRILGADHPYTLIGMNNLAMTRTRQRRWVEAEQLQLQVVEATEAKLGTEHPGTIRSKNNLISTYCGQWQWAKAEQVQVQVLETNKTKLGVDHPDTMASMHNLACIWRGLKPHKESMALMWKCFERQVHTLGIAHNDSLSSLAKMVKWKRETRSERGQMLHLFG